MNDVGKAVTYTYDSQSRISVRKADNIPVYYTYTRFGQLETKSLGSPFPLSGSSQTVPIAYIKYFYGNDGQITARDVNGNKQDYKYDLKGQLLAVVDATGKAVEQYVYDAAGNILSKTIDGKVTNFKYDKANQLVSSTDATGKVTNYDYDAAGRLTKEGSKEYAYGWLDKVVNVSENGKLAASFDYGIDGQLSNRTDASGKNESFTWDGLALIKRDSTNFVNESAVTGGNPILAFGKDSSKVLFEDMLGSTVGSVEGGKFSAIDRSAFGESKHDDNELNFFTGKPQVEGLGYAFLFRNYRAEQGKWQTQDPIGYPDGWNNLAYVNNGANKRVDPLGLCIKVWWGWIRCGARRFVISLPGESIINIPGSVTATCGGSPSQTFNGSVNIGATVAEIFGIGVSYSYSITIQPSLTGDPHDGTGGGSITKAGCVSFTWTEDWYEYPCGEEEVEYSGLSGPNLSDYTVSSVKCIHE
jgi:RHS repeat-associated protein